MTANLRKEHCYLTPKAEAAMQDLANAGITDKDLALEVLERLWPDTAIYSLEEEGEDARG